MRRGEKGEIGGVGRGIRTVKEWGGGGERRVREEVWEEREA